VPLNSSRLIANIKILKVCQLAKVPQNTIGTLKTGGSDPTPCVLQQ